MDIYDVYVKLRDYNCRYRTPPKPKDTRHLNHTSHPPPSNKQGRKRRNNTNRHLHQNGFSFLARPSFRFPTKTHKPILPTG